MLPGSSAKERRFASHCITSLLTPPCYCCCSCCCLQLFMLVKAGLLPRFWAGGLSITLAVSRSYTLRHTFSHAILLTGREKHVVRGTYVLCSVVLLSAHCAGAAMRQLGGVQAAPGFLLQTNLWGEGGFSRKALPSLLLPL
jgi:hypothetical protein